MPDSIRYERGMATLRKLDAAGADDFVAGLKDDAPDLLAASVEFVFGDVLSRGALDLKTRELLTVAMLAALGDSGPQLAFHVRAAGRQGVTREEIGEVVLQVAAYAGFPRAVSAMRVAKDVWSSLDEGRAAPRY